MNKCIIVVAPNGDVSKVEINGRLTLEFAQKMVGGYIETVQLNHGLVGYWNEDAKRLNLPINAKANKLFPFDVVRGNLVVFKGVNRMGYEVLFTQAQADKVIASHLA